MSRYFELHLGVIYLIHYGASNEVIEFEVIALLC